MSSLGSHSLAYSYWCCPVIGYLVAFTQAMYLHCERLCWQSTRYLGAGVQRRQLQTQLHR